MMGGGNRLFGTRVLKVEDANCTVHQGIVIVRYALRTETVATWLHSNWVGSKPVLNPERQVAPVLRKLAVRRKYPCSSATVLYGDLPPRNGPVAHLNRLDSAPGSDSQDGLNYTASICAAAEVVDRTDRTAQSVMARSAEGSGPHLYSRSQTTSCDQ